ncbi:hypothetical protein V1478_004537 [Vespula squamosa]|uniref:Uncharacterized protein n=1 Tax=Vespula squamosa TaxID=30214 RepID=A0ABD2BGU5_VESSQ
MAYLQIVCRLHAVSYTRNMVDLDKAAKLSALPLGKESIYGLIKKVNRPFLMALMYIRVNTSLHVFRPFALSDEADNPEAPNTIAFHLARISPKAKVHSWFISSCTFIGESAGVRLHQLRIFTTCQILPPAAYSQLHTGNRLESGFPYVTVRAPVSAGRESSNGYSFGQTNLTQCKAPTLSLSPCARHSPRLSGVATNHQERDISWGTIPINLRRMYALPLPVGREPGDMPAHVIPYHRPRTSSVLHTKRPWKLSFMGEKVDLLVKQ